jgi:hypothetical protein
LLLVFQLRSQISDLGCGGLNLGLKSGLFMLQIQHSNFSYDTPGNHVLAWIATRNGRCRVMDAMCAEFLPQDTLSSTTFFSRPSMGTYTICFKAPS